MTLGFTEVSIEAQSTIASDAVTQELLIQVHLTFISSVVLSCQPRVTVMLYFVYDC